MLYDHHGCSESAITSQPIFTALNHVKLDKQSTRKYLYSLVWQWAQACECCSLSAMGRKYARGCLGLAAAQGRGWVSGWSRERGQEPGPSELPAPAGAAQRGHCCSGDLCEAQHQEGDAGLDVGRVCCRTQNDGNQFQQGSRRWILDFRNIATYAAPGFRHTAEDKKKIWRLEGWITGEVAVLSAASPNMEKGVSEWSKQGKNWKLAEFLMDWWVFSRRKTDQINSAKGVFRAWFSEKYTKHECYNAQANDRKLM